MKKKILAILLSVAMIMSYSSITFAEDGNTESSTTPDKVQCAANENCTLPDGHSYEEHGKYEAMIGDTPYETLAGAVEKANSGDTVTMVTNVTLSSTLEITKSLTLDLGKNKISYSGYPVIKCATADITVTIKNGTIYGGKYYALMANAGTVNVTKCEITSDSAWTVACQGATVTLTDSYIHAEGYVVYVTAGNLSLVGSTIESTGKKNFGVDIIGGNVTVDKNTTITSDDTGIAIYGSNATVNVYGTVTGTASYGISTNGSYKNDTINVYDTAIITGTKGAGIYAPAKESTTNIYGGKITGYQSAIEVRGGTLNIKGGEFTATAEKTDTTSNPSGTTVKGAAVAVSQHTNQDTIVVNINGGTFTGIYAVWEVQTEGDKNNGDVTINIKGGEFNGKVDAVSKKLTVTGGTFPEGLSSEYYDTQSYSRVPLCDGTFVVQDMSKYKYHLDLKHLDAKDSTATEPGNIDCYYCSACEKYFTGAGSLETVIDKDEAIISETNDDSKAGHSDLTEYKAKDASATEDGNYAYWYCSTCKQYLLDENAATGVDESATVILKTNDENKAGHSALTEYKAEDSTATEDGNYAYWYCGTCKQSLLDKNAATGVDKSETVVPATTEAGKTHSAITHVEAVAATATKDGNIEYWYCGACEKYFSDSEYATEIKQEATVVKATGSINKDTDKEATTDIVKAKDLTLTLSATKYTYDGKAKTPTVTLKDKNGKVVSKSNYTVKYSGGHKNVGTYKATVTLKGNYSGTLTANYKINPKGTSLTKMYKRNKGFTAMWKQQGTQTTGYQVQYSTNSKFTNAKTVSVTKTNKISKRVTGLKGKTKYYVRVRTYKTVGSTKYYSDWSKAKSVTTYR